MILNVGIGKVGGTCMGIKPSQIKEFIQGIKK